MTNASAEDKRADERRIKELRDFQRANPANKRCFDCNEMMPQYICLDFNTFVCTSCSGIHREFAHRIKSISMSKFTDTEVKNMIKFGGNEAAQKIWRAKHDASYRPSGGNDGERIRNFIRLTYIDRKWAYESPKNSSHDEPQRTSSKGAKRSGLGPDEDFASSRGKSASTAATPAFDAFSQPAAQQNNGGFSAFGDFTSFDQPKKQQNDFEDFGGFAASSSSSTGGFGGFGGFDAFSNPQPAAAPPLRDEFKTGSFKLAPPPGSDFAAFSAPAPPPAPTVSLATAQASNDFLAFSPPKAAVNDPFGFDASPAKQPAPHAAPPASPFDAFNVGSTRTSSSSTSSAFDAFGSTSTKTSSRPSSSSFDAFGAAAAPATTAASGFDAFGASPSQPTKTASGSFNAFASPTLAPTSPADPFGAPSTTRTTSSSSASAFDAFGSSNAPMANAFDAFGAAPTGFASAGQLSSSRSGSGVTAASAVPSDPFAAFSPRTSSGTKAPEPPKTENPDPFNAFDGIDAAPTLTPAASAPQPPQHFGASSGYPTQPTQAADPFAFAAPGSSSKNNSFSGSQQAQQANTGSFGDGRPAFGMPMPGQAPAVSQQPPHAGFNTFGHAQPSQSSMYGSQGQYPMHDASQFGSQMNQMHGMQPMSGFPHQAQHAPPQQGWTSAAGAGSAGVNQQYQHQNAHNPGQMPGFSQPHQATPAQPPASKAPDASSLKDPFAALSLGSFGMSGSAAGTNSGPSSRGGSFANTTAKTGSGSLNPAPSAFGGMPSMPTPQAANPSAFPGMMPTAPGSSNGSRGNSFESPMRSMSASRPSASPMASFSLPTAAPSSFQPQSQSPMASFSMAQQPANSSKQGSFAAADPFAGFSSSSRTGSRQQPPSFSTPPPAAAAASNPFDMF
ncbi:hypothetical protein PINS_up000365 [Pythium insidiosum]|nr:hypothetical protein PINS_up000365 [Pythium insidiosum]